MSNLTWLMFFFIRGSGSVYRIQIQNEVEFGSNTHPDNWHWFLNIFLKTFIWVSKPMFRIRSLVLRIGIRNRLFLRIRVLLIAARKMTIVHRWSKKRIYNTIATDLVLSLYTILCILLLVCKQMWNESNADPVKKIRIHLL